MSGWNQALWPRDQILLVRETLGDRIPDNHSVRLFAEILDQLDWSSWERHYVLVSGQPLIHPQIMAGAILYGLTHGIRSSRPQSGFKAAVPPTGMGLRQRGRFHVARGGANHRPLDVL